jgi:hypothetical protein
VGGVSESAGAKAGGSDPSTPSRVAAVKGIPVSRKPAFFAERRRNGGLGRSVSVWRFLRQTRARRRQRMSGGSRGGERRRLRRLHAQAPNTCTSVQVFGDASFARSSGTCTSILTTHRGSNPRWWGARGGITAGQTCASGRNQRWGRHERTERGSPRVTAPTRERAWHERKGWRSRPPSLRGHESSGLVARTSIVVAEVGRRRLASNKLGKRAPKRAAGSSERGPSSSLSPSGETGGAGPGRRDDSRVGRTPPRRARNRRRLGVARDRHPAVAPSLTR